MREPLISKFGQKETDDKDQFTEELKELYRKGVGEIGITPSDFWLMTIDELDCAYEGYLRRKELEANLFQLAMKNSLSGKAELIRLLDDKGYIVGSQEERDNTFLKLGIIE